MAVASKMWTKLAAQEVEWQFAFGVGVIGLLPYLVIAAVVWRVNLRIFGNQVSPEQIQPSAALAQATRGSLEG